jgi:FtsP/CotA-like multicopper oxidase with cupredoxin domain
MFSTMRSTALVPLCGSIFLNAATVSAQQPVARDADARKAEVAFVAPTLLHNISTLPRTVEVNLTAEPAKISLRPGVTTDVFAYNGQIPGPTLDIREGDHVIIHFTNKLSEPTTVHWHGLHIPAIADGSPFHPIGPGQKHDYVFTIAKGTAGTYWYHPHPDSRSGYQVAKGLYGGIIIRAADDPLPRSMPEKLIILGDNRFNADGQIDWSDRHSPQGIIDEENGREGNLLFVNGEIMPTIKIRPGEVQRWRVVNASASRIYRLALQGQTLLQVGTDGGLFEHPSEEKEILVANSERVEFLVRGTAKPGSVSLLETLPYDRYAPQTRPTDWNKPLPLLSLETTNDEPVAPVSIPATLRHIPILDTTKVTARRVITLSQGLINGKMMDMSRVDIRARLNTTEIWSIENVVGMDHPFHLHGFQFQVLDKNGVPEKDRRWKDTVNVPKHETVRFVVRYDDNPGLWMFHCHILDHEDHGMMAVLQVK